MNRKGFTLVELLAVIAILAILVLIALPNILTMFRKSREDTFLVEARAIMNAAETKMTEQNAAGDYEEKIYCKASGQSKNELDTTGRDIFYLIHVMNNRIVSYAISDNQEHTVFNVNDEGLHATDITELYENVIDIKDCDLDYLLATRGHNPDDDIDWIMYDEHGNPIKVPYSGFTGYSCQISNFEYTPANLFTFDKNTKTITKYLGNSSEVIIPCKIAGVRVEHIGANAFSNKNLITAFMPDTIQTIGANAFYNNKLTTVGIGNSVKTIECGAFANNKLSSVMLPSSLERIGTTNCSSGYGVFQNNTNLQAVRFQSASLKTIGSYTFSNTKLSSINLSSQTQLETIGDYAFSNNKNFDAIKFSTNIKTIGKYAFKGTGLQSIYLASNVGVSIGEQAFADNRISKITLTGVKSLGPSAFVNNQMPPDKAYIMNVDANGKETGVLNSYAGASRNNITIPDKVKDISQATFKGMGLTGTLDTGNSIVTIPGGGSDYSPEGAFAINNLTKIIIGSGVRTIQSYAFAKNYSLKEIEFREGIESLGCGSFRGSKVENVVFPNSLKRIESCSYGIFEGSNTVKDVKFGNKLEYIGSYAFSGNKLTNVDLSNTKLVTMEHYAFSSNQISELKLPTTLRKIGSSAFYNNKMTKVSLKGNNLSIDTNAFSSNQITDVEIGGSYNTFNSNVFSSNKISKLTIDGDHITIGNEVFANNQIKDFSMKGVTSLGTNAFKNNKMVGDAAFVMQPDSNARPTTTLNSYGGEARSNIVIPDSVTQSGVTVNIVKIPDYAFSRLGLTGSLTMGQNVSEVGNYSFGGNSISSLNLKNVTRVGNYSFAYNQIVDPDLSKLRYMGTSAFKSNKFSDSKAFVMNIDSSGNELGSLNSYAGAKRSDISLPNKVTSISSDNFYYYNSIYSGSSSSTSYNMYLTGTFNTGNSITSIPSNAFYQQQISKINMGNSIKSIDSGAFYYNTYLEEVNMGDGVETIGSEAFRSCTKLSKVTLGSNVQTIGNQAFRNCSALKTVNFNNKLKRINAAAFAYTAIEELNLPDSLEYIGGITTSNYYYSYYKNGKTEYVPWSYSYTYYSPYYGAFSYMSSLKKVTFGSGIKTIEPSAFYYNTSLATIDMSKITHLEEIPDFAFTNGKYSSVTIPASVLKIGDYAFDRTSTLSEINIKGKAQLAQFTKLGTRWNGDCSNIKFEVSSCFEQSNGILTHYNPSCSRKAVIPTKINNVNITGIGDNVFSGQTLTSVYIPVAITSVSSGAFNNASASFIMVQGKKSENGFTSHGTNWNNGIHVIYEKDQTTCLKLDSNNVLTGYYYEATNKQSENYVCDRKVVIPNTVTGTKANALKEMILDSITVANGTRLTTNGMGANWNGSVPSVNFSGDSYDYNCFTLSGGTITGYRDFCKQDVDLTLQDGKVQGITITKIGNGAFKNLGLTSFVITDNITEIGDEAFVENHELKKVSFEGYNLNRNEDNSTLRKIGNKAFYNCDLQEITLPKSLKVVGNQAFDDNIRLSKIYCRGKKTIGDFESLGYRWNGDCSAIYYQNN